MKRLGILLGSAAALAFAIPLGSVGCATTDDAREPPPETSRVPDGGEDAGALDSSLDDAGCDPSAPDCAPAPLSCDDVPWCPVSTGVANIYLLTKVWGTSKDDVWAVGSGGTVIHWNGSAWSPSVIPPSPAEMKNTFFAVGGTGANDVWVASTTSSIFHNDGSGWTLLESPAPKGYEVPVFSIWTDGLEAIRLGTRSFEYVVNTPNGPLWLTGNQFANATVKPDKRKVAWEPQLGTATVVGYYGTADDLWLIGDNSTFKPWQRALTMHGVRAKGGELEWTEVESNALPKLHAIWGSSAEDIWAVGDQGILRRMRPGQSSWEVVPSPTNESLFAVWGTSASDVWAAGENGTILHFDGTTWSSEQAAYPAGKKKPNLTGIWGSGPEDVWIVGGTLALHFTGKKEGSK